MSTVSYYLSPSEQRLFQSKLQSLKSKIQGLIKPLNENDLALFECYLDEPEIYWDEMEKLHSDPTKDEYIKTILDLIQVIWNDFDNNKNPTSPCLDYASKYAYSLMKRLTQA